MPAGSFIERFFRPFFPKRGEPADAEKREKGPSTREQFATEVFPRELQYVRRSRKARGVEPPPPVGSAPSGDPPSKERPARQAATKKAAVKKLPAKKAPTKPPAPSDEPAPAPVGDGPSTSHGLIGLAFSGGGIRSATFNLGILQALHKAGFFKHIDLMSTVSGGGFIGSALTSLMSRGEPFPFDGESPAVVHLRNNSNYLAPSGLLDYLRMFAVLIRGIILNFLVLVPFLLVPILLATLLYGPRLLSRLEYDETAKLAERLLSTAVAADPAVKIAEGEKVEPLLKLLERGGFLPLSVVQQAAETKLVTRALREPRPSYRDVKRSLLTGTGSKASPFTFLRGVELRDVAHRLVDADLLVPPKSIEEVQAVELAVRRDLKQRDEGSLESLIDYFAKHLPRKNVDAVARPQLFMVFVDAETLVDVLIAEGIVEPQPKYLAAGIEDCGDLLDSLGESSGKQRLEHLDSCGLTETDEGVRKYSLTQILQAFYDHRLFDRRQIRLHLGETGQTRNTVYRWPDDESTNVEIELAALHLWNGLVASKSQAATGGSAKGKGLGATTRMSVADLFAKLPDLASGKRPLLRDLSKEESRVLAALKATGLVVAKGSRQDEAAPAESRKRIAAPARSQQEDAGSAPSKKKQKVIAPVSARQNLAVPAQSKKRAVGPVPSKQKSVARSVSKAKATTPTGSRKKGQAPTRSVTTGVAKVASKKTSPVPAGAGQKSAPQASAKKKAAPKASAAPKAGTAASAQSCTKAAFEACEFADARSLSQLPRVFYERRLYNEGWFKKQFTEISAIPPRNALKRKVKATPLLGEWFDPAYVPQYKEQTAEGDDDAIDLAANKMKLEPGPVSEVLDKLVGLSVEATDVPVLRPSRTPAQREILRGKLRAAFQKSQLINCEFDSCEFTIEAALEEVPYVLYQYELYNRAWFEKYLKPLLPASADPSVPATIKYRKKWDEGWRTHQKKLVGDSKEAKVRFKREKARGETHKVTVGEVHKYLESADKVDKTFKELLAQGLLLDDRDECLGSGDRKQKKEGKLTLGSLKKQRRLGAISSEVADCEFELDATVQWLFDDARLPGDPRPVQASNVVPKSILQRVIDGYERHVLPRVEGSSWNPRVLRLPLTAWVSVLGLLWVLAFPIVTLATRILKRQGDWGRDFLERSFALFMVLIAGVAFLELQPYLVFHWHHLEIGTNWSMIMGAVSVISMVAAGPALAFFKKVGRAVVIVVVSLLGPLFPFVIYLGLLDRMIYSEAWPTRQGYELHLGYVFLIFLAGALLVHLFLLFLDPNSTGMHGFYKGRLAKAYVLGREGEKKIVGDQDLALSEICSPDSEAEPESEAEPKCKAPYHLLNVALNLQGSRDASVRDRHSDFFTLSGLFAGGGRNTGYCRIRSLERLGRPISLGTAMAVSAAAAAPNMGSFTVGPLVILLALLNVRLGYWVPNPRQVKAWLGHGTSPKQVWLSRLKYLPARMLGLYRLQPGAYAFLRELLSKIDDRGRIVNISDGGHIENTAIFELLRRRCSVIIAGDAEADPELNFGGLAALQRLARLDLEVEIEISTANLGKARMPDPGRRETDVGGSRHYAVGTITYPEVGKPGGPEHAPEETGYLIYLKSSMTGDESQIVAEYHGRRPLFPHESTADQFFDEGQFEAYRDLGSHVVDTLHKALSTSETGSTEGAVLEWLDLLQWKSRTPAAASRRED